MRDTSASCFSSSGSSRPRFDILSRVQDGETRPRVLVLLAAYNGERWIGGQIRSILDQDDVDIHVAIRDDRSSDATLREIATFADDPRVSLISPADPSGSAAQNFFALIRANSAAGFDFVAFSDQDDLWYRDKLTRACRALRRTDSAGYSSATIARWQSGKERCVSLSAKQNASDFLFEGAGQGCTFVISTLLFGRIREFIRNFPDLTRGIYFHDWAVYALARSWGLRWHFDPRPSMTYRQHGGNDTGARGSVHAAVKRLSLVRSGWYRRQLEDICRLCAAAAPGNSAVARWQAALLQRGGWRRRARLVRFLRDGGRRRRLDNAVLLLGSLAGWI